MIATILLLMRHKRIAITFMTFALINLLLILPLYLGSSKPTDTKHMRAMLINVNTRLGNPQLVIKQIHNERPDFVVLEEINYKWFKDLTPLTNSYPYVISKIREDNFGICLFSKHPFKDSIITNIGRASVPSIIATIDIDNQDLKVIATHPLPPATRLYAMGRNEQLEKLAGVVDDLYPTLLIGDLNMTPWSYHFLKLIKDSELKDSTKGFGVQPTWPSQNIFLRLPLDHCLHSSDISIIDRRIGSNVESDHYPLIVDFSIDN
jgi:endonuclease/exonuclease/phosphatase (EEP) superfamily protein YafD